jgi:hypothetical protein
VERGATPALIKSDSHPADIKPALTEKLLTTTISHSAFRYKSKISFKRIRFVFKSTKETQWISQKYWKP